MPSDPSVTNKLSDYIQGYAMDSIGRGRLRKRDIFFYGWLLVPVYRNEYKRLFLELLLRNIAIYMCILPYNI